MSKTVTITTPHTPHGYLTICPLEIRDHLALKIEQPKLEWIAAGLFHLSEDRKNEWSYSLTPRGQDLLDTWTLIPEEPEPEPVGDPCESCKGAGIKQLFTSEYACETCQGTGIQSLRPSPPELRIEPLPQALLHHVRPYVRPSGLVISSFGIGPTYYRPPGVYGFEFLHNPIKFKLTDDPKGNPK